jgi:hypothetical protein
VRAGADLPDRPCVLSASEFTTITPVERRADAVVLVGEGKERVVLVGEVQGRIDPSKAWTWPEYVVGGRSQHRCPARLVVFALTDEVAKWALEVTSDIGLTLHPIVIGPADLPIPAADDHDAWLAERLILAAVVHGNSDRATELARLAPRALLAVDDGERTKYLDVLFVLLKNVAHDLLGELMLDGYEIQDPWLKGQFQKATEKGLAEGRTHSECLDIIASLLDGADQIALGLVVALVTDGHDDAGADLVGLGGLDDLGVLEHGFEMADPGLHFALLFPGGVVVAVLGKVAELTGALDLAGDIYALHGRELQMFCHEAVMGRLGKVLHVGHGGQC